jgi:D-arabinose 1-dehydrogenase-like Zn-dependent alcohol dehydrogenase
MVLTTIGTPLVWTELPDRYPGAGQIRLQLTACGVCRTDLHVVGGELPQPQVPIIPGHEIVGRNGPLVSLGRSRLKVQVARACTAWKKPVRAPTMLCTNDALYRRASYKARQLVRGVICIPVPYTTSKKILSPAQGTVVRPTFAGRMRAEGGA